MMNVHIHPVTIRALKDRGGLWAVYQNQALDSAGFGHLKFLRVGEGCTYLTAPSRFPDTEHQINWKYQHVGTIAAAGLPDPGAHRRRGGGASMNAKTMAAQVHAALAAELDEVRGGTWVCAPEDELLLTNALSLFVYRDTRGDGYVWGVSTRALGHNERATGLAGTRAAARKEAESACPEVLLAMVRGALGVKP